MKVPVYERSVLPPGGNWKAIEAAGIVGESISGLGRAMTKIGLDSFSEEMQKQHSDRRARLAVDSQTTAMQVLYNTEEEIKQDKDKHLEWGKTYAEKAMERLKEIEYGIDDDRVKEAFRNWSLETVTKGGIRMEQAGTEMAKMLTIESTGNSIATFTDLAIKDRGRSQEYIGAISSALNLGVASGAITPEQREAEFSKSLATILDGHVDNDLLDNPWKALKELRGDGYQGMHERRRTYWIRAAQNEIDARERDARREQDAEDLIGMVQFAYDNGLPLDHEKHQKAVDAWYERHMKVDLQNIGDIESRMKVANFVGKIAVVPTPVQSYIRAHMNGSAQQAVAAADLIDRIHNENPVMKKVWTDDELAYAGIINNHMKAGTTPGKAVEYAKETVFKMPADVRKRYEETYRKEKFNDDNAKQLSKLEFVDGADIDNRLKSQNDMLVENYYKLTGGNITLARTLAANDLMKKWSREKINGKERMMYLGPTRMFGGDDRNTKWIPKQFDDYKNLLIQKIEPDAKELLRRSLGRDLDVKDIDILADEDFQRNPMVGYALILPTGELVYTDTGKVVRWVPDYTKTKQFEDRMKRSDDTKADEEWAAQYKKALNGELEQYMKEKRSTIDLDNEARFLIKQNAKSKAGEKPSSGKSGTVTKWLGKRLSGENKGLMSDD